MADLYNNFATSTVATAPSPATSGTSLVVAAGEGSRFPAAPFNLVIAPSSGLPTPANAEIVRVTAKATDTLTIDRQEEGTSARTVVVGDRVYQAITADALLDLLPDGGADGDVLGRAAGVPAWLTPDTVTIDDLIGGTPTIGDVLEVIDDSPLTVEFAAPGGFAALADVWHTKILEEGRVAAGMTVGVKLMALLDDVRASGTGTTGFTTGFTIDPADYDVAGYDTEWRIKVRLYTNTADVGASVSATFGLYPLSFSGTGAANTFTPTAGTVVTGSDGATITNPTSAMYELTSSEFAVTADDLYALGVLMAGATTAANSTLRFSVELQYRHVPA